MRFRWITNNILMKMGALLLAIALWIYIAGEEKVESSFNIPVELVLADDMVVIEQNAFELKVLVKGRKEVIAKLADKQLFSRINLRNYSDPQTITYNVDQSDIPIKSNIKVLKIKPEKLIIKIDKMSQKILPVEVVTKGDPAQGYKVNGFVLDPVSALVKGPEKYLRDMQYIKTEYIDITGRRKSFKKMIPLQSIPMIGEQMPPQFVEVVIRIEEEPFSFFKKGNSTK